MTNAKKALLCISLLFQGVINAQLVRDEPGTTPVTSKICLSCEGGGGGGGGAPVTCIAANSTLYVDDSRPNNTGNGQTWATAKKTLHAALYIANRCPNITRINVARGIYKASNTTTPNAATRDNNFFIGDSYSVYGGYPTGGGTRDFATNPTILDGEIQDLYEAYHVVSIYGVAGAVTIDGFQIKNGFADGAGSIELDPNVTMARNQGAGIYIKDAADVTVRNCAIYQNVASGNGGGIYSSNSTITLVNNVLAKNSSVDGGALQNVAGSVANLVNCTFGGNTAAGNAGVAYSTTGTQLNITNTVAWGNVAALGGNSPWGGGGIRNISHSLIENGNTNNNGLTSDPGFNNPDNLDGADNQWFTSDDGLAVPFCSPAVNRGDNDATPLLADDITGRPRKFNEQIDMGAYESQLLPYPLSPAQRSIHGDANENYVWSGITAIEAPGCRIIATVLPTGAVPVRGRVRAKTFIENDDNLTYIALPLVKRHYELDSYNRINGATSKNTLFFGATDFSSYNQRADAVASMPSTDGQNKANLRVIQFHGKSTTGMPGSYDGNGHTIIDPDDADIFWSPASLTWRVSFNAAGPESGFFLAAVAKYRFTGTGNWNNVANWENGKIPPTILPAFCEIIIANGSNCTLGTEQKIKRYATLTVEPDAKLNIEGGLLINLPEPI